MSDTSIRYTERDGSSVEILRAGQVIASMALARICELDADLAECAARAVEHKGQLIQVPARSNARGVRRRNYGAFGIAL